MVYIRGLNLRYFCGPYIFQTKTPINIIISYRDYNNSLITENKAVEWFTVLSIYRTIYDVEGGIFFKSATEPSHFQTPLAI